MTCLPSQNASSPTANALRKSVAANHMRNKTDINDCKTNFLNHLQQVSLNKKEYSLQMDAVRRILVLSSKTR
jgi:hypothetical protein